VYRTQKQKKNQRNQRTTQGNNNNSRGVPPLIVIQVREEHVLLDGFGQRRHGFVVFGNDLEKDAIRDIAYFRATHKRVSVCVCGYNTLPF
jgi:hypothetical protein